MAEGSRRVGRPQSNASLEDNVLPTPPPIVEPWEQVLQAIQL